MSLKDPVRLLFSPRPDGNMSVFTSGYGSTVREDRDRIHGALMQAQHLFGGITLSDQRIADVSKLPESAVEPSAEIASARIGPPCPLNCASAGAIGSTNPTSTAQPIRRMRGVPSTSGARVLLLLEHKPLAERQTNVLVIRTWRPTALADEGRLSRKFRYLSFGHDPSGRTAMRSFIIACIAAVVIATIGAMILNFVQEPADVAFTVESARI